MESSPDSLSHEESSGSVQCVSCHNLVWEGDVHLKCLCHRRCISLSKLTWNPIGCFECKKMGVKSASPDNFFAGAVCNAIIGWREDNNLPTKDGADVSMPRPPKGERWLIILIQTTSHVLTNGEIKGLWEATNICLKIFQTLAFLEVFHVLLGLVRSGIMTTLIQVSSRLIVLWLICYNFKVPQNSYGLLMILIAWSITEITRYSFYFLNLLKQVPSFIIYLRYTLFIVLYPLGVTGEQWCIFVALSEISKTNALSIRMPNVFNFTFDLFYFCIVLMLLYIPFFPQLYLHMFAQRKKMIGDKHK